LGRFSYEILCFSDENHSYVKLIASNISALWFKHGTSSQLGHPNEHPVEPKGKGFSDACYCGIQPPFGSMVPFWMSGESLGWTNSQFFPQETANFAWKESIFPKFSLFSNGFVWRVPQRPGVIVFTYENCLKPWDIPHIPSTAETQPRQLWLLSHKHPSGIIGP
jgi:hypothetical protein